jgi:cytochrome c oxidase assembly protein subunit 15
MTMSLLDWTPVFKVMISGLLLAMGPLAWVWVRQRGANPLSRLHALTLLTLFLTLDLIMFGAFTRLTDSGLGCPDWPGCYGSASPIGAHADISAAQSAMPSGPVTLSKAWIEMIHRYLATGVGVLILVLCGLNWRSRDQGTQVGLPLFTLLWVCVQGAFGALTVTMKLLPAIVTLHLMGGLTLLALLTWQAVRSRALLMPGTTTPAELKTGAPSWLRGALVLGLCVLVVQIALGGWVSTNYAVLACQEVPTCQGSWWPPMNFSQGFTVWRELGMTPEGTPISFEALTAIHMVHRLMAVVVLFVLGALAFRMKRTPLWRTQGRWLNVLLLLQLITGLSNVILGWPLLAAVLHTGGAAGLLGVLTWALAVPVSAGQSAASASSTGLASSASSIGTRHA